MVVGDRLINQIDAHAGLIVLLVDVEVDAVTTLPDGEVVCSAFTPQRWAIMDNRRTSARDQRPIMGLTPRANQYTTNLAAPNWQSLNNPQKAAFRGLVLTLDPDDLVV